MNAATKLYSLLYTFIGSDQLGIRGKIQYLTSTSEAKACNVKFLRTPRSPREREKILVLVTKPYMTVWFVFDRATPETNPTR